MKKHTNTTPRRRVPRLAIVSATLALAAALSGCVYAPPYAYAPTPAYGYAPAYGYGYAPAYYAPSVSVGVGFGGYGHWHGR
ncbi:hypothetical protein [Caballeronia sp. BCC1704]|uniref:hypothetical protein n=1 Tax=Caballeronia sp. BCC1704 TaxID=2676300 RepID=UPI00158CEB9C|nr:hypothetical protein [Caballeronia sp. BCC1704]